jgi:uncharacterized coiled-coil DUF342 family protein
MLYDLQKSVKSEEDKMLQKIHDLETRLAVAGQASGDNNQLYYASAEIDSWDVIPNGISNDISSTENAEGSSV